MLALEKSSIASSNSNKATLSQDILTTKRKRCMSIDERNQFVGKRLKIVYIATLPQNLTKLPRNSQIGNALSMAKPETINSDTNTKLGTTKNTDKIQINNENNQIASEWNDKDINGDMLKWNKNVNTTNSQVLQSQNPMQYSTSKECKKYTTSTGGSTITGTEKEGCTLSGAKVILSKQTHASHATDNISMDINGTENSPRILNSSQVIGTIDSGNIPCEYGQKINESMQKDPFMLSDRNTIDKEKLSRSVILKSQIRNHDRIDTNNGSAVASAENTSIDNVNCIELTRIPVKLEKHNVVADSSNISCPNSKSGSERSTSYLNSTSRWPHEKSNNNKKQSVVNISTISQKDLMKFLSRYNLTLKAVPENTSCTVNMGLAKFRTVSVDSNRQNSHVSSLGQLSDASNAKTFILSDSETIQNKFQPGSNETGKNPVANRKLRYEGNTIFRSTPQGTFSDWKIEGARSAKLCKRRSRVRFNGNIGRICKKSMRIRNSACFKYTETGNKNLLKKNKIADVAQPTVSTYNRSETPDTSGFECPFKMFPLSNAFRDLELRDKATRETLETSKDFNNSVSVGSATGQYLRTLSPTMTSLFNDGSCLLNAGEFHADPVLTSAVAFNSTETVAGDLSDDFVINQVLLSPVASKNESLTCRNFTRLKRKTSVLEKEDITTSSSEDNKSQSVGESTNITELASENLYGFPVSDMEDEASNSIPSIDLSAPKCSVGDSSTKYCVKRSKSTTTRDNIAMTLKSNKNGCNNSTNKSNLCHRGTKNCVSTVSSATLSSCHCSTDACVVSHDSNTSSRSERTQVGTEFNKKNKDITQQQLSKYPTKAIEKWSSEEVASWLNDTIRHYELDKTSLCTNLDSKNVENQKRTGNIFSGSFLNGRALRNLELDKFHEYCKNDLLLAEHLIKKVKELLTFLNGKSDSEREINENEMYHQYRGQCVVVNPNCVPATSVEQLEESVNFEDLLGSDSVLGSLEIADVLDFQGSFLKSLGQENERRLHHRTHSCNSTEFFHNHFSPAGRVPSYEESTLHKNKFAHYPDVYHDTRSELLSNDSVQHSLLKEFSSYPQQNKVHDFFTQASYDDSVSSTTEYYPPVSPSTYYNVPPPPLIAMHDCVSNVSTEVTQKPASIVSASGELATPNFISLRDPAMSDTDSGIHSPESSPNKYTPVVNTTGRIGNNMPDNTENRVELNGVSYCGNNTAWQQANSSLLKSLSQNVAANILTEVSVPSKNDSTCPVNDEGSKEDLWERGSTSSTTSTLTAGESEPKLFNMDDCQTYIADASMQSLPSFANSTSSLTVRTLDGNVVFVPSSLNDATKANAANSMVQSQNTKGCHQFVTQGNITTVYPSFVSHNRRIGTTTQDGEVGVNGFRGQNMESIVPTNALITKQHSDPLCGIQNRRFTGFHSNKKRQFQNGLSRRHTCDGQDAAFIDSFDLKVRRTSGKSIHLWEFIRDTLLDQTYCPSLIKWEDRKSGIFRFVQSDIVAGMWGKKKNNPKMTYEKLSRAMRYYYNRGILERVDGRRLVYKFGPNAHGWQQIGESNETQEPDQNIQEEVKVKPEKGPRNNPLQSQKNSLTTSLRRPANCKISVTMSDNVLPDSRKRRRCSSDQTRQNKSTIDVAVKAKSTETQTMPSLIEQIVKVKKECEKMMEVKPESFKSTPSPQAEPTSCIVYVARQGQPAEKKERQCKEDKVSLVPSPEALKWSNDQQISNSPSKLPSAEVLLGKHYKIATVAT